MPEMDEILVQSIFNYFWTENNKSLQFFSWYQKTEHEIVPYTGTNRHQDSPFWRVIFEIQ